MVAIGLVPALTLEAAKRAALGAGAKVVASYGYEIDEDIVAEIEELKCDIIMLCGGTDGGNKDVICHNAEMLAGASLSCPILVCGNRSASTKVRKILQDAGKQVYMAPNVLPEVNRVEVGPVQETIREIFIEHIVKAKGLDKAADFFCRPIIPTPMASIRAAQLLSDGTPQQHGIGSLMVVEVGGATTNIHSVCNITPVTSQTVMRGLPDSKTTRTVEGDLGIRWNARTIYEMVGGEKLKNIALSMRDGLDENLINPDQYTAMLNSNVEYTPKNEEEYILDAALAKAASEIASMRHAGTVHKEQTVIGEINVQHGKNLLNVKNILGTGGIFKYGKAPEQVLKSSLFDLNAAHSLRPMSPKGWIDKEYIMYAVGLLAQEYPDEALAIAKKHLQPLELELPDAGDFSFDTRAQSTSSNHYGHM